jgi:peptide/nickel transport system permease protein
VSMLSYLVRRLFYMAIMIVVTSIVVFTIIQLPPGDYATSYINQLRARGAGAIDESQIAAIKAQFGLDLPMWAQYLRWASGLARGNLGVSFYYNRPIQELLGERLPITIGISIGALLVVYVVAIPIGIYSATHQYSILDYVFTFIGFVGVGIPGFLFALILLYVFYQLFGFSIGGIFSPLMANAPWSWAKVRDMMNHLWAPIIIAGTSGTCGLIRVLRATLLDELNMPYVVTARAKGLTERRVLVRYPVRVAMNPILSTVGWVLPDIFSGSTIVAVVLALPTVGPLLLDSLMVQDFYVAGSVVMILTVLTLVGTLISDILLVLADPRIRFD